MHKAWCSIEEVPCCFPKSSIKFQGYMEQKKITNLTWIGRFWTVTPIWIHRWIWHDVQSLMYHKRGALFFSRSSLKFQGHMGLKINDLNPISIRLLGRLLLSKPERRIYPSVKIPSLLQIMACRLADTKPLSEPMLEYCELDPKEHISVRFYFKFKSFLSKKCTWKCRLRNGSHFISASMY